jgi:hypothetical protein
MSSNTEAMPATIRELRAPAGIETQQLVFFFSLIGISVGIFGEVSN